MEKKKKKMFKKPRSMFLTKLIDLYSRNIFQHYIQKILLRAGSISVLRVVGWWTALQQPCTLFVRIGKAYTN